jgi:hypothetical protein
MKIELQSGDSAFLYVIFTFQCLGGLVLGVHLLRVLGVAYNRNRASPWGTLGKIVFFLLLGRWTYDTYYLVEKDIAEGGTGGFDPYKLLHIENDASFASQEIRQAYRRLSLKYHPDKIDFNKVPEVAARRRY